MIRGLTVAIAAAALALPGAALAAKPHHAAAMKAGQACTAKKAASYQAHHFKCVKGHLRSTKPAPKKK